MTVCFETGLPCTDIQQ